MTGHHQPASETPFKWRLASWPIMAPAFSAVFILSPLYQLKKKKPFQSWVGPPLTKFLDPRTYYMLWYGSNGLYLPRAIPVTHYINFTYFYKRPEMFINVQIKQVSLFDLYLWLDCNPYPMSYVLSNNTVGRPTLDLIDSFNPFYTGNP